MKMGIRTIRLDDDAEQLLSGIIQTTGMSISTTFKEGLKVLRGELEKTKTASPYAIFEKLDLGPGGYAKAPSSETKKAVKEVIRRKLKR
jgi:hypothetical protein